MATVCFNGKFVPAAAPVLQPSNRGYRYGDGLFETIKLVNGSMAFWDDHFQRLQKGCSLLQYQLPGLFSSSKLKEDVLTVCRKNNCTSLARIRISLFRGNGGLYDGDRTAQYLIECWPLAETALRMNENGLVTGIYPLARKSCDAFSNLKTANFLPYSMAAQYAMEQKLNDCFVLNTSGAIADSTIANVFLVKNGSLTTPALTEGCVEGITRNHLLKTLPGYGYQVVEKSITTTELETADEIFLTNSINGIRWVGRMGDRQYTRTVSADIYHRLLQTIQG